MTIWSFAPGFPEKRASTLLAPASIGSIADRIAEEMEVLCCHFDLCRDHSDFRRVIYCLRVTEDLFDLFFNSAYGYRAAYFRSPYEGMAANRTLINAVAPKLLSMSEHGASSAEFDWIRESLMSHSSKVWLAENGSELCPKCEGEWSPSTDETPEILNGRWEIGELELGRYGRRAPVLTKIRIFGAFLDDRNNEFIPWRKRHRARDIHLCGWS